jgi:hypothetical protein
MVAGSHNIYAGIQQTLEGIGLDAESTGDVLPIGDAKVDVEFTFDARHALMDGVSSRFSDDVADDEDVHFFLCFYAQRLGPNLPKSLRDARRKKVHHKIHEVPRV